MSRRLKVSSLQGSLGDAFLQEAPGRALDAVYRQAPRSPTDNQPLLTTLWQVPAAHGNRSGVQELPCARTRHAIYKLAADENILHELRPIPEVLADRWIVQLERQYILEGKNGLVTLLQEQRGLPGLLLDAVPQLRRWFGDRLLQLRVSADEEDITARASVVWSGGLEEAEEALRAFDRNWWLANCPRSNGYLVFDFELVDGV
jgi:hypothetical protein